MDDRMKVLEELYHEVGPRLLRYLSRQVSDKGTMEELLQDTFVVVAKDYDRLSAANNPEAWLFGIARNLLRSRLRKLKIQTSERLMQEVEADQPIEDSRIVAMRNEIAQLPGAQREALQLRIVDELSYVQIAEITGAPLGTVRSRIHHAVSRLRASASKWGDDGGLRRAAASKPVKEKTR